MSKLRIPSFRKPPLAETASRIPLPPQRIMRSDTNSVQTTPVSLMKTRPPSRLSVAEESDLRPEYQTISCDFRALEKMVKDEFGNNQLDESTNNLNMDSNVVYERGRLYEEYTARRNERLRRKRSGATGQDKEKKTSYNLGVNVEPGKRRDMKKSENFRKSLPPNFAVTETPRYSLRSNSKENKKPPLAVNLKKSVVDSERRVTTRRTTRRI